MKTLLVTLLAASAFACFGCASQTVNDSGITTKVKSKLAADSDTSAIKIGVETTGGAVTLSGTVPTQAEKSKAEQIAKNTEDVKSVVNNITVKPDAVGATNAEEKTGTAISDTTILAKIKAQFVADGIIGTNVDVTGGEVVLKGEVDNAQEKTKAEEIARKTDGVKSIKNQLTIKKK